MTVRGQVQGGVVVLDDPGSLPDGTQVSVRSLKARGGGKKAPHVPSLYDRLKPVIGKAKGLPHDLARNHDHYLHGRPKQ